MKDYTEELLNRIVAGEKKISVCHITLTNGQIFRFVRSAEGNPETINDISYEFRFKQMGGLKESPFTAEVNRQNLTLSNVNSDGSAGELGLLVADLAHPLYMAKVDTFEYFPLDNSFLYYYDGFMSQPKATEQQVECVVVDASEAAGLCFANVTISTQNGFTNPDPDEQVAPSGGDDSVGGGTYDEIWKFKEPPLPGDGHIDVAATQQQF